jgi:hypothetical protein
MSEGLEERNRMKHRRFRMLASVPAAAGLSIALSTSASAAPGLAGGASGATVAASTTSTTPSTFVKVFSNGSFALTTEDVQPTSDGGHIALAETNTSNGVGVSWLLKLDSAGNPQWQEEVGCFKTPPGDNAIGHSLQQTSDGGYIFGGGTIGCGSKSSASSASSGIASSYVVKLGSTGRVAWAKVYDDGIVTSDINRIEQTSDGGYIAAGSADANSNGNTAGFALKLDSSGNVQWQRKFSPSGSTTNVLLNAVRQTSDGGYITAGQFTTSATSPGGNVLAVKLDSSGQVQWENGYDNVGSGGTPVDRETVNAVLQTSDGGYLVGGDWGETNVSPAPHGGLLLKLDSSGAVQSQHAYTGRAPNGDVVGSEINSVTPLPSGGFLLGGAADLVLLDGSGVQLVPYIAEVDSSFNLTQQNLYTEPAPTGRPISDYFAAADLLANGGALAGGFTEDPTTGLGDLYLVQTDSTGQIANCNNLQPAPALNDVNPGLAPVNVGLTVDTTINAAANSPATAVTTTPTFTTSC